MTESRAKTEAIDGSAPTVTSQPQLVKPLDTSPGAVDPRIGMLLKDCYRIERRLGAGGMGAVYLAEHEAIKKKVAVKILDAEAGARGDLKERFLREARAAAAIPDDHVIAIHDFGDTPDGSVFFVMEYLQGVDLANVLAREAPLPWPRARDLMLQICRALQAAHDRGIVHRDMKPANVFRLDRTDREVIKVLDFGIAKTLNPDDNPGGALTRTGMLFGTPEYMSPEQAQGDPLDHRVDVYASGVILFEMLTGKLPFRADTFMALLNRHMFEAPPRPSEVAPRANIPPAAEAVVLKALQKNPALRFQSMNELAEALVAVDSGIAPVIVPETLRAPSSATAMVYRTQERATGTRRLWILGVGLLVGVAVTAGLLAMSGPSEQPTPPPPLPIAAPPVVAPPPVPEPVHPPPATTLVVVRLDTGKVVASIYDEDDAFLGTTASPDGLILPRSEVERRLVLRAPGYEDMPIKVIPSRDEILMPVPMTRIRRATPHPDPSKSDPTKSDPAAPDTKTDPTTPDIKPDLKSLPPPDTKTDTKAKPADTKTDPRPDPDPAASPTDTKSAADATKTKKPS